MKKLIAGLTVAVFVFAAGAAFAVAPAAQAAQQKTNAEPFDLIIIKTDVVPNVGGEDPALTNGLAQMWMKAPANVTLIDYKDAKSDPRFTGIDMSFMPVYLIKATDKNKEIFKQPIDAGMLPVVGDFLVFLRQTRNGVYMDKKVMPKTLEIFIAAQCPYSVMALDKYIQARKNGTAPKDIQVKLRYFAEDMGNGAFRSMHGDSEWEEGVRQLIIQKYYPSLFWKYMEIRNKNYTSSRWDLAMKEAGINPDKVMKKWNEGLSMLKEEAARSNEFSVNATPSFLWEGRMKLDWMSVTQIPGLEFFNPNLTASAGPVPPQGGQC